MQNLGCFGAVAGGEATPASDANNGYQVLLSTWLILLGLSLLREELVELLDYWVDMIEFQEEMPVRLRERVRKDAIYS